MTFKESCHVGDSATSEFEGLRRSKQTTLAFVQSGKGVTHRLFHRPRIPGNHRGFLPMPKNPFPGSPDYQPNRVPKSPNATVNKFCILTGFSVPRSGYLALAVSAPTAERRQRRLLAARPRSAPHGRESVAAGLPCHRSLRLLLEVSPRFTLEPQELRDEPLEFRPVIVVLVNGLGKVDERSARIVRLLTALDSAS